MPGERPVDWEEKAKAASKRGIDHMAASTGWGAAGAVNDAIELERKRLAGVLRERADIHLRGGTSLLAWEARACADMVERGG